MSSAKTKCKKNKTKKSNIFNRNIYCFASAGIAAIIMIFTYCAWKFFPVGENIILRMDLYHQYAPLFAELYERIFGGHSLLYSFTSGLGSGFLGNYFNYLSSPTLLFVLIFGHKNVPEAVAAMVLVKAAVSSYTFTYFLSKVTKKSNIATASFGLLYSFCGYFIAYYWNVMWLDAMAVFPLVILGIYYIVEEKKSLPYILSLAYVMVTNYYMAYMTCILSVIFFLYFYFSRHSLGESVNNNIIIKKKYKHSLVAGIFNSSFITKGASFAASSILAAMIACFALLPVWFILRTSSATHSTFPDTFESYFTIFDYFANHLAGVEPTIRSSGDTVYPNVYCGILTLILVPLFMFSKKFKPREKIAATAVLGVFFLSFNINMLNFIWHGFHFPNDLPYRFSFAYSFFLLYIAYRVFTELRSIKPKEILISASAVAAFAVIVEKVQSANVDLKVVWTSISFAIIYAVILLLFKSPKYVKSSISILLMTAVCAEILISDTPNYKVTQTKSSYTSSYDDTEAAIELVRQQESDDSFYRMELATLLTRMDNCWFFYPGVSTFTSMAYEDVAHLQDYLGLFGNRINSYTYNCQTGLYNSMTSIKYIVDNSSYVPTDNYTPRLDGNFLYSKVGSVNNMSVYRNKYWLPVAFSVNSGTDTAWLYEDANPFAVQNDFFYNASGVSDILNPISGRLSSSKNMEEVTQSDVDSGEFNVYKQNTGEKTNELSFVYHVDKTQDVYTYFGCNDVSSVLVTTDGFSYNQSLDNKPYVLDIGKVEAGSDVYITYSLKDESISGSVTQYVYGLDEDKFVKAYDEIVDGGILNVTENKESRLKGTVDLKSGKMLYTSIPYDTAWSVYVDGAKVPDEDIVKIGNALMGIKMDPGSHTVEMKYMPNGLLLGLCITAAGVAILIIVLLLKKKKKLMFSPSFRRDYIELGRWRDMAKEKEKEEEELLMQAEIDKLIDEQELKDLEKNIENAPWEKALDEAENYITNPEASDEGKKSEELKSEVGINAEENYAPNVPVDDDGEDEPLDPFDEDKIDKILTEFEESTRDVENKRPPKITKADKKSAQKKRLNLVLFVIIAAVAVILAVAIMVYAVKNNENRATTAPSTEVSTLSPAGSDSSADNSGTAGNATTNAVTEKTTETAAKKPSETTTKSPETTTKKPPETTTKPPATTTKPPATTTKPRTEAPATARPTSPPTTSPPTTLPPETYTGRYVTHTVAAGDNFYSILRQYNVVDTPSNVQRFCALNGLTPSASLTVGQKLLVPVDL